MVGEKSSAPLPHGQARGSGARVRVLWLGEELPSHELNQQWLAAGVQLCHASQPTPCPPARVRWVQPGRAMDQAPDLTGQRLALIHHEGGGADAFAEALRARGATVAVLGDTEQSLQRALALEPHAAVTTSPDAFRHSRRALRSLWTHPLLRWTPLLVVPPEHLGSAGLHAPNLAGVGAALNKVLANNNALLAQASGGEQFSVALTELGPGRMLRALLDAGVALRLVVICEPYRLEIDLAEGIIVGAQGVHRDRPEQSVLGVHALAVLVHAVDATVHVRRVQHPAETNIMAPLESALMAALQARPEESPRRQSSAPSVAQEHPGGRKDRTRSSPAQRPAPGLPNLEDDDPTRARVSVPEPEPARARLPKGTLVGVGALAAASQPDNDAPSKSGRAPAARRSTGAAPRQPTSGRAPAGRRLAASVQSVPPAPRGLPSTSLPAASHPAHAAARSSAVAQAARPAPQARKLPPAPPPPAASLPKPKVASSLPPVAASLPQPAPAPRPVSGPPAVGSVQTGSTEPFAAVVPLEALPTNRLPSTEPGPSAGPPVAVSVGPVSAPVPAAAPVDAPAAAPAPRAEVAAPVADSFSAPLAPQSPADDPWGVEPDASPTSPSLRTAPMALARRLGLFNPLMLVGIGAFFVSLVGVWWWRSPGPEQPTATGARVAAVAAPAAAPAAAQAPALPQQPAPRAAARPTPAPRAVTQPTPVAPPAVPAAPSVPASRKEPVPAPTPTVPSQVAPAPQPERQVDPDAAARTAVAKQKVNRGHGLRRAGRYREARNEYLAALRLRPSYPRALAGLAHMHLARKDYGAARRVARQLVRLRPGRGEYHLLLGDAYKGLGRTRDARKAWRKAARKGVRQARKRLR